MTDLTQTDRILGGLAALAGFLCVGGGAFGAHGLQGKIPDVDLAAFETGMRYGLVHAVAALVGLLLVVQGWVKGRGGVLAFLLGILLFTGSLAFLGLTGSRALVLVTPLGGLSFL